MSAVVASLAGALSRAPSVADGVSTEATAVLREWYRARRHFYAPTTRVTLAQRFLELSETWREERGFSSSISEMVLSPAYQQVIGLGPKVVPSILLELTRQPDHWFWALRMLTRVDPVPAESRGNVPAMAKYWIEWGESEGLLD